MQSLDELGLADPVEADETNPALEAAAQDYLNQLRMQQMLNAWTGGRKSKHNAARAQRAKVRIAKRKAKR